LRPDGDPQLDLSRKLEERASEWGAITERARKAVLEGRDEKELQKYKKMIDDYYREVAKKASERQ